MANLYFIEDDLFRSDCINVSGESFPLFYIPSEKASPLSNNASRVSRFIHSWEIPWLPTCYASCSPYLGTRPSHSDIVRPNVSLGIWLIYILFPVLPNYYL